MAKILRGREVTERTGLSRTSLWRREKQHAFPHRVALGPNSVGWFEDEIDAWIEEQRKRRDADGVNADDQL